MRTIAGFQRSNSEGVVDGVERANKLNLFFNRFNGVSTHPPHDSSVRSPSLATQLNVFSMSLRLQKVLLLWKTSCLVPVPNKTCSSDPKDYRPLAPTSHIMKILERLVLEELRPMVRPFYRSPSVHLPAPPGSRGCHNLHAGPSLFFFFAPPVPLTPFVQLWWVRS